MSFISYQIKEVSAQRIMVKATWRTDHLWCTIFCIIVYWGWFSGCPRYQPSNQPLLLFHVRIGEVSFHFWVHCWREAFHRVFHSVNLSSYGAFQSINPISSLDPLKLLSLRIPTPISTPPPTLSSCILIGQKIYRFELIWLAYKKNTSSKDLWNRMLERQTFQRFRALLGDC